MTARVVVAGASGFIGTRLAEVHRDRGAAVTTIGRGRADVAWNDDVGIRRTLDGADLLVNFAGRSVNCRYTPANRAEILRSRVETTRALGRALEAVDRPPALWVNSSTATIYRHAEDRPMTESTGELGTGFSVSIARAWEDALAEADLPATRRVALRMAIVLGDGSALAPLRGLARIGFGGPQIDGPWFSTRARREAGTFHEFGARGGHQRFSWVHLDDVIGSIDFLEQHAELTGPINVSSPNPVDNVGVMRELRAALGTPFGLPIPRPLLELGSMAIRTETELVLKSRWVLPERLLTAGYAFRYPTLRPALDAIVAR